MSLDFLLEAIKNPRAIGAVAPSSRYLTGRLTRCITRATDSVIEFGAGSGAVTEKIVAASGQRTSIACLDLNRKFCEGLRQRFGEKIIVINDSVENIACHLNRMEIPPPDCIISSLPFTIMPQRNVGRVLKAARDVLTPDGVFLHYQYLAPFSICALRDFFPDITLDFVVRNIPPAWVYECRK